jgi:hypothetical protein
MSRVEANPKGHNFRVPATSDHEHEAKAAQMKKRPNRLGMFFLRILGYTPQKRS